MNTLALPQILWEYDVPLLPKGKLGHALQDKLGHALCTKSDQKVKCMWQSDSY